MKYFVLLTIIAICSPKLTSQPYYVFPSEGWSQTQLFGIHNGLGWDAFVEEFTYAKDTLINGMSYQVVIANNAFYFARNDNGKIYWLHSSDEALIYDFSLNVGDTLDGFYFLANDMYTVTVKEQVPGPSGDSLWYMEIKSSGNFSDPTRWMEGVGNLNSGLFPLSFPDAGYEHICTRNKDNQTYYASAVIPVDCNCDYIHGKDLDGDGFRNHQSMWKYIQLSPFDWPPSFTKHGKHRTCDTLVIINETGYSVDAVNADTDEFVEPDSIDGGWEQLFYYNLSGIETLHITHQFSEIYFSVSITECEINDCNDLDSTVHASHPEIPYNGVDNDCNPETPDDDIDQDGFLNAEDCNDQDASIHPEALEIPDNGVDEDCDGNDLTTKTDNTRELAITIYPNPVSETLFITSEFTEDLVIKMYDLTGHELLSTSSAFVDVKALPQGIYFLEIKDTSEAYTAFKKIVVHR